MKPFVSESAQFNDVLQKAGWIVANLRIVAEGQSVILWV